MVICHSANLFGLGNKSGLFFKSPATWLLSDIRWCRRASR